MNYIAFMSAVSSSVPDTPAVEYSGITFTSIVSYWIGCAVDLFNLLFDFVLFPGVTLGWFIVGVFVLCVAADMLYNKIVN